MHVGLLLSIYQRSRMLCRKMSLRILFLLAGSLAGPSLTPAPLFYLDMSSDPPARGDSARLVCIAPKAYVDSEFWLLKTGLAQPVQMLFASEAQHRVTFILENITGKDAGQYRCKYHSYNGSARQMSEFSNVVEIAVAATPTAPPPVSMAAPEGSPWLLPVSLSVAGALLLTVGLVVAVVAVRRVNVRRQQLKRDRESCWTETNFPTTDMSFDNCLFTVSAVSRRPRALQRGCELPWGTWAVLKLSSAAGSMGEYFPGQPPSQGLSLHCNGMMQPSHPRGCSLQRVNGYSPTPPPS
ncbi:protein HIDE1 isoform X1 [Lepidochelys kempii]|uniref:protein HIDE1 isoform X1 n=1 Tax=Lepidochelys kempii TaxID=8472 RepID=UPI002095F83F|nr:protein HIDE1 isoform X1 [Caretta caretta]